MTTFSITTENIKRNITTLSEMAFDADAECCDNNTNNLWRVLQLLLLRKVSLRQVLLCWLSLRCLLLSEKRMFSTITKLNIKTFFSRVLINFNRFYKWHVYTKNMLDSSCLLAKVIPPLKIKENTWVRYKSKSDLSSTTNYDPTHSIGCYEFRHT
jgi:hypothetical protein